MANHKRKHRKWQKRCMCKQAYKGQGNATARRTPRDLRLEDSARAQMQAA